MAQLVGEKGRVISFEPSSLLFDSLVRNIRANGIANIEAHHTALGSAGGTMAFSRSAFNSGDNTLSPKACGSFRTIVPIRVARLDDLCPSLKIDVIKMDVQGWELEVLKGMTQTLVRNPNATLFFEFWPQGIEKAGCNPIDLLDFVCSPSRTISVVDHGKCQPLSDPRLLLSRLTGGRYVNLVAAHSKSLCRTDLGTNRTP
jgi:FkbM family methyltransferase